MRIFLLIFLQLPFLIAQYYGQPAQLLRVMTFNIWNSGRRVNNGLFKIIKHICLVDPDIVLLQEVDNRTVALNIAALMPGSWSVVFSPTDYTDTMIMTKHKIVESTNSSTSHSIHALIEHNSYGFLLNVWGVHADYQAYGPYAAFNSLVKDSNQIMHGEKPQTREGRAQNMLELSNSQAMLDALEAEQELDVPIIVGGDFNSPSHLDWVDATRPIHGGWKFDWPATKILEANLNMTDAYRQIYPNPVSDPGTTWSTCNKGKEEWEYAIPEPQDRIDFIYYRSKKIKPVRAFTYAGTEKLTPIPHQWNNDWPSDHYAVVVEFAVKAEAQNTVSKS